MKEQTSDNTPAGTDQGATPPTGQTRREVVRSGIKLAFVVPVVSTFLAANAYAARYSCYPVGHACDATTEPCCGTACPGGGGVCPP